MGRPRPPAEAVRPRDGSARADRRSRRLRARRAGALRRRARPAQAGEVLGAGRAGRRQADPGDRPARGEEGSGRACRRRPGAGVRDAHAPLRPRATSPRSRRGRRPTGRCCASPSPSRSPPACRSSSSFATPEFCASRTCGPVVDVVEATQRRWGDTPVRFIHVEVFEGNDPAQGTNRWVKEWGLPTEPWTFLVGRDGRVEARLEGASPCRSSSRPFARRCSGRVGASRRRPARRPRPARARGLSRSNERTISAQSSGWIISAFSRPVHVVIGVSTNAGQSAVARMPCSSSSRSSECVSEISAAFDGAVAREPGGRQRARDRREVDM